MSLSKVNKDLDKYQRLERQTGPVTDTTLDFYLLGDSKVKYLKNEISRRHHVKLQCYSYPGVGVDSSKIITKACSIARLCSKPTIVIWLGTCELTTKTDKAVLLSEAPVDEILEFYIFLKFKINTVNSSANVIFLDCPYYSIIEFNRVKYPAPAHISASTQKQLESKTDAYNSKIRELNRWQAPKFSQDLIRPSKPAKTVLYKKNYTLLLDGIHPSSALSRLWLFRLYDFIRRISTDLSLC